MFFKDQTIEDIDKTEKLDSHTDESLVEVDSIRSIVTSSTHEEPKVMIKIMMRV